MKKKIHFHKSNIDVTTLNKTNGFSVSHLKTSEAVCIQEAHAEVYDDTKIAVWGMSYIERRLIKISDISLESNWGSQKVRANVNPLKHEILESIKTQGWKLSDLPISVYVEKSDSSEYQILEGRTRLGILSKNFGIEGNVVVDVYHHFDASVNPQDFAQYLNSPGVTSPKANTTEVDADVIIKEKLDTGEISADHLSTYQEKHIYLKDKITEIVKLGVMPLKTERIKEIVTWWLDRKIAETGLEYGAISFDGIDVKKYAEEVLGIKDDSKIRYLFVTADEHIMTKQVLKKFVEMRLSGDNRHIRVITFTEVLDPQKGFANHWGLNNVRVGRKIERHLKNYSEMLGMKLNPKTMNVSVYGTIPQAKELANQFPMDKLVLYKDITDEIYTSWGDDARRKKKA